MKNFLQLFVCIAIFLFFNLEGKNNPNSFIVTATKKITIEGFSEAFNPSIIKIEGGFLLSFRYCLYPKYPQYPYVSYIGIVRLDEKLNVISRPQLLNTREEGDQTPSQAEDARLFTFNNRIFLIYNDNVDFINPSIKQRRDMFIAELDIQGESFKLKKPLKLYHEIKYKKTKWQKNWVPFEWNNHLLIGYSIGPHEILDANLSTGLSKVIAEEPSGIHWQKGILRGGTPALLVDGSYLAFFHSAKVQSSTASEGKKMHHYFMGAYVFSANPPFRIKKISTNPIIGEGFYTKSSCDKRVIFPGGFAIAEDNFYLAYGKNDSEVWIATINKKNLMKSLKNTKKQ